jgi:hypothetical protein
MVTAVVIAFIAVGIAVGLAVTGLLQIADLRRSLVDLRAELLEAVERVADRAGELAISTVKDAVTQLKISREEWDKAIGSQRQHTGLLYLSADADVTKAGDLATELADYTVRDLEHQVTTGAAPLTLRGGFHSGQPAVLDVLPRLIEKLIGAIGAEQLYSQNDGPYGRKFYVRWPAGAAEPASLFGSLLSPAPASDGDGPVPGAAELAALLDVVRDGYPVVLHFGSLVVVNILVGAAYGFAPPGWTGPTEQQKETAVTGIGTNLLTQIGATGITDLSQ